MYKTWHLEIKVRTQKLLLAKFLNLNVLFFAKFIPLNCNSNMILLHIAWWGICLRCVKSMTQFWNSYFTSLGHVTQNSNLKASSVLISSAWSYPSRQASSWISHYDDYINECRYIFISITSATPDRTTQSTTSPWVDSKNLIQSRYISCYFLLCSFGFGWCLDIELDYRYMCAFIIFDP